MKNYKKLQIALPLILMVNTAYAIDLQPGEAAAPRPNINLVQFSYAFSDRGNQYINGHEQSSNKKIQTSTYNVRLGRSFELANMPGFFYVQTPMGAVQTDGFSKVEGLNLQGDTGVGDTSLAFALWPYSNRETRTYFGVAGYLTVPSGSYDDHRVFNMGENRYRSALQTGYQTQLSDRLSWMAALDGVFYQDNKDYYPNSRRLEQKNLYTFQTGLKYDINPQYSVAAAYFYTVGGETRIDGLSQDNLTQLQRYQVSAQGNYSFGRMTLQYGGDLKTENGYIEDHRLIVRYTMIF